MMVGLNQKGVFPPPMVTESGGFLRSLLERKLRLRLRLAVKQVGAELLALLRSENAGRLDRGLARFLEDGRLLFAERVQLVGEKLAGLHRPGSQPGARASRKDFR